MLNGLPADDADPVSAEQMAIVRERRKTSLVGGMRSTRAGYQIRLLKEEEILAVRAIFFLFN